MSRLDSFHPFFFFHSSSPTSRSASPARVSSGSVPRPTSTSPTQNTTSPLASKRSYRWGGRINTPSNKIRTSEVGTGSAAAPHTPPAVDNDEADLHLADHTSPSLTPADPDHISDSNGRPRRRRRPR